MAKLEQYVIDGLGHQSYLITDDSSGHTAVIDPRRDVDIYIEAARSAGLHITHVLETHIHNDYVTGSRELAAQTGATIVASTLDPLGYPFFPVKEGDRFQIGQLTFQALATPGHTPAHTSYLFYEPGKQEPQGLFSGGSLLAGNAGRTDLLGPEMTITLTRQQYHSLRRLLDTLPASLPVYPTHGAGSFCMSTSSSSARTTTIGQERLLNPAALVRDENEFIERQISGYTAYPAYYAHMGTINQAGPRILGGLPAPSALTPNTVQQRIQQLMPLIDGRPRLDFAREHIPGSLNIELDSSFATYVGWILPFNVPLMILIEDEAGRREAVAQLMRIGYERVDGFVDGGITAWKAAALPVNSFESIDIQTLHKRWQSHEPYYILDVRRDDEWNQGHIPDAHHIHVGDLPQHIDALPKDQPIITICQGGYRASIAASMIAASGREVTAVSNGMGDWLKAGLPAVSQTGVTNLSRAK